MTELIQFTCVNCNHDFEHEGANAYIWRHNNSFDKNRVLHNFSYSFECPRDQCKQSLKIMWVTQDSKIYFYVTKGEPTVKEMVVSSLWDTVNFYSTCMMIGFGIVAVGATVKFAKGSLSE